ncbi:MAG: DUF2764 family protein [Oligoflexia bacterium]|nr:DUF2764 family protein [Oligoflexia bacterium]
MKQYYYFIASLREISLDVDRMPYTIKEFVQEARDEINNLDKGELKFFDAILLQNDNLNVISYVKNNYKFFLEDDDNNNGNAINGTLTTSQIEEDIAEGIIKDKYQSPQYLPLYLWDSVKKNLHDLQEKRKNKIDKIDNKDLLFEDEISMLYYQYIQQLPNEFLKMYFQFDYAIKNLLVTYNAKKFSLPLDSFVLPFEGDSKYDTELEWSSKVEQIFVESNLQEREKSLDRLRFQYIDRLLEFDYFGLNIILGYLVKLITLQRWNNIKDKKSGQKKFTSIVNNLLG